MSEPIPAEIFIGGQLSSANVEGLLAAIVSAGACKDYDSDYPKYLESLLDCVDDQGHLHLANGEANYGTLDDLEEFCRAHRLSYNRYSDAKYDYDGIVEYFRARENEQEQVGCAHVSQSHELLVSSEELQAIVQTANHPKGASKTVLLALLRSLNVLLNRPPSLPKFEVLESTRQKRVRRRPT